MAGDLGQVDCRLHTGIAAADDHNPLPGKERRVTNCTVRDAMPHQCLLAGDIQALGLLAGGDQEGAALEDATISQIDLLQRAVSNCCNIAVLLEGYAKLRHLVTELVDQFTAIDISIAKIVLDSSGFCDLTPNLPGHQPGHHTLAHAVNCSGETGGAGAENDCVINHSLFKGPEFPVTCEKAAAQLELQRHYFSPLHALYKIIPINERQGNRGLAWSSLFHNDTFFEDDVGVERFFTGRDNRIAGAGRGRRMRNARYSERHQPRGNRVWR